LIRPDVRVLHSRGMPATSLSVIVPVFNRRELVLRAIESVLAQEGASKREVIVVDDGSTDGTADAINKRFGGDARVRVISSSNAGASAARNLGLRNASGEFVCFLDSDDFWLPGMLSAVEQVLAQYPRLAFVSVEGATLPIVGQPLTPRVVAGNSPGWSHAQFRRARLQQETIDLSVRTQLLRGDFFPAIVFGDLFYLSGMVMRRDCAIAAGPFNERFRFFNDWEFFSRLCRQGDGTYIDVDGFRRDAGRDDQISRRRPATAMPRRQLFLVRAHLRRPDAYATVLRVALADACYQMARSLLPSPHPCWARRYLLFCLRQRYKFFRALALLISSAK
jgi:glycosyltransferase involved in cell wall biosynthesis